MIRMPHAPAMGSLMLAAAVMSAPASLSVAVVVPTPEVLAWQLHDTGCFVTYNMAVRISNKLLILDLRCVFWPQHR